MTVSLLKQLVVLIGFIAATMAGGAALFAADDMGGRMMGPSADIKKETIPPPDSARSEVRDAFLVPELTSEMERPMKVPDPRSDQALSDRQPLCGPWKNAINHVYCAEGYDTISF
jgi:hypothetical protein